MAVEGSVGPGSESGTGPTPKQTIFPDIIVAIYGSGRSEARIRGSNDVFAEAPSPSDLVKKLMVMYPAGFKADFRDDPHM